MEAALTASRPPACLTQEQFKKGVDLVSAEPASTALGTTLQAALSSSYLQKLRQLADSDSAGPCSKRSEGVLVLVTPAAVALAPRAVSGLGEAWQMGVQCELQVCWLMGDASNTVGDEIGCSSATPDEQVTALVASLQRAGVAAAAAARLATAAAPGLGAQQFGTLLPLPGLQAASLPLEVGSGPPAEQQEPAHEQRHGEQALTWIEELPADVAMEDVLLALVANLEGSTEREREAIRRKVRQRVKQQQRQQQGAGAAVPRAGAGAGAAAPGGKGQRALQQAKLLRGKVRYFWCTAWRSH